MSADADRTEDGPPLLDVSLAEVAAETVERGSVHGTLGHGEPESGEMSLLRPEGSRRRAKWRTSGDRPCGAGSTRSVVPTGTITPGRGPRTGARPTSSAIAV